MRTEVWLLPVYLAFAGAVIGGILRYERRKEMRLRGVSDRAAQLTPVVPAPRHPVDPRRARPVVTAVYWSKEAIKSDVIAEYESSRETLPTGLSEDEAAIVYELGKAEERSKHRRN